jgi:hypothetical protein
MNHDEIFVQSGARDGYLSLPYPYRPIYVFIGTQQIISGTGNFCIRDIAKLDVFPIYLLEEYVTVGISNGIIGSLKDEKVNKCKM